MRIPTSRLLTAAHVVFLSASLAACQVPVSLGQFPTTLGIDLTPASLYAPAVADWSLHRVSNARINQSRKNHYRTLAFPAQQANWNVGATPGLPLTSYGCAATDFMPNGPASSMHENATSPLYNKIFFLTKAGKLIKSDRVTPATYQRWDAPLGKTFSRTFVTLSPQGARAYVLSDDGVLYIVNTRTMVTAAAIPVGGGGWGIAPWIDPYASRGDDQLEQVYVASNNGTVNRYQVTGTPLGVVTAVSAASVFNVATGVTPMFGGTRRIAAPPVVLGGVIYVGDQGGNFHAYDTNNTSNNLRFPVGAPVSTAAAIEIQDGSYSFTDPSGAPKSVGMGVPVYAWVAAGGACAWLNLHDQTATRSQPLRIDDNDAAKTYGYLRDYNSSTAVGSTETIALRDGGNINTEAPNRNLPGEGDIRSNDVLAPAETNTYATGSTPRGGPVVSYLRWQSSATYAPGTVIQSATLSLRPVAFVQGCPPPEIRATSPYDRTGLTPWASDTLSNVNRPSYGLANVGTYTSGGINGAGNVPFFSFVTYQWDVSAAFAAPHADGAYALALKHEDNAPVYWPAGPVAGGSGLFALNSATPEAVRFRNNPLNADPTPADTNDVRPVLTLAMASAVAPSATIETPPFIDSVDKRVYMFYTNAVYSLNYASPGTFSDTLAGQKHTLFNAAWHGVSDNNARGVGGLRPGGAYNKRTRFVGNFTAPVPANDLTAVYVLSRAPGTDGAAPTSWNYALSKIGLPLSPTADKLEGRSPTFTGIAGQASLTGLSTEREASSYMAVDPVPGANSVYFGLASGRVYQYTR